MTRCASAARLVLILIFVVCGLQGIAEGGQLVGVHFDTGDLYTISSDNGQLSRIGSTGIEGLGALERSDTGDLYGFTTGRSGAMLYRVDPASAAATAVGPLNLETVFEGGLAIAPDGTAYAAGQDTSNSPKLFQIDLVTGASTVLGPIGNSSYDIDGLAWRSDGLLVGLDGLGNDLVALNPTTRSVTKIADLIPTVGAAGGMAVVDGIGYFSTAGPTFPAGSNQLWRFDLFSGAHELVGSLEPTITGTGISGLTAVPEPGVASASLATFAYFALARRRTRCRTS